MCLACLFVWGDRFALSAVLGHAEAQRRDSAIRLGHDKAILPIFWSYIVYDWAIYYISTGVE